MSDMSVFTANSFSLLFLVFLASCLISCLNYMVVVNCIIELIKLHPFIAGIYAPLVLILDYVNVRKCAR